MMTNKRQIIFIEDDSDTIQFYTDLMKELQYDNINFLEDGIKAFEYLKKLEELPLIIICDIKMPKLNGLVLREYISQDSELKSHCNLFAFLTAANQDGFTTNPQHSPTNGFYEKPLEYEDLKALVKRLIEQAH